MVPMLVRGLRLAWLAPIALFAWAPTANATSVEVKGLRALSVEADAVFLGTVSEVRSQWVDDKHTAIETFVTFVDVQPLLGEAADGLTLRFSGGTVDGIREEIVGMPRFERGERVVLFVHSGRSVSPIVGFSQGCFRVIDGASGPVVATAEGHPVYEIDAETMAAGTAAGGASGAMSLDEFLRAVRAMLKSTGRTGS